jgi:transposase-like protein
MIIVRRLWIAFPVIWLCFFGLTPRVYAGVPEPAMTHTVLTIEPLQAMLLGDHPVIVIRLTTAAGLPIGGQTIRLLVNDTQKRKVVTNSAGIARLKLNYKFSVGTHHIKAAFLGSSSLGLVPAVAERKFVIKPLELVIRTTPPLAGIQIVFNHKVYTTNQDGMISISVQQRGTYPLEILQPEKLALSPDMHVTFARWNDEVFEPNRKIKIFRSYDLEAGFIVSYRVRQIFVDSAGQLIDPARISTMTLKAVGKTLVFEHAGSHWLPANELYPRIDRRLESSSISYSIRNIIIDDVNVVSEGQQRFYVRPNAIWPIKLLVFSARFFASDALFRFPVGSGIRLEHPDGRSEDILFKSAGDLEIGSLPRGLYRATVTGARGMAPPTPLALSQSQDVELLVISLLDMVVVFIAITSIALGLLFFGRPQVFAMLMALPGRFLPKQRTGRLEGVSLLTNLDTRMIRQCPSCQATIQQSKAGLSRSGRQRYLCYACGQIYTPTPYPIGGYSSEIKMRALQLHQEGNSRRSIGRILKIRPQTVSHWIADRTIKLPPIAVSETLEVGEPDERFSEIT